MTTGEGMTFRSRIQTNIELTLKRGASGIFNKGFPWHLPGPAWHLTPLESFRRWYCFVLKCIIMKEFHDVYKSSKCFSQPKIIEKKTDSQQQHYKCPIKSSQHEITISLHFLIISTSEARTRVPVMERRPYAHLLQLQVNKVVCHWVCSAQWMLRMVK